jgi:hypothetical protein
VLLNIAYENFPIYFLRVIQFFWRKKHQNVKDQKPSIKHKLLIKWSGVGVEEGFNATFLQNKILLQKMFRNKEEFCYEYLLDSTAIAYINGQIDQIMQIESNHIAPDPEYLVIDGWKYEVYFMDQDLPIRNISIENTEIAGVVDLKNFAWSYYKPAKVGN